MGSFLLASLVAFVATAGSLLLAADELAAGRIAAPAVLLAVHLLVLGFLPLAVGGAALHVLPVFLRVVPRAGVGWAALAGLSAGPLLAIGVARHSGPLTWPAVAAFSAGLALLLAELGRLVAGAPAGKVLVVSRFGVAAAGANGLVSFLVGPVLFSAEWRPWVGIPHDRLIAIHLHLAVIGCLTLLIVTVGRTLGPMLAMSPAAPARRLPADELLVAGGTWVAVVGLACGERPVVAVGALLVGGGLARFGRLLLRTARTRRTASVEAPLAHLAAGLAFLAQAAVLCVLLLTGRRGTTELTAYAVFLLLGWVAGVTLGHVGRLLALSAWTWWPPGERPRQTAFFDRRAWALEAVAFVGAVELLAVGVLTGSAVVARIGAGLLVVAALLGLGGALRTTWPSEQV